MISISGVVMLITCKPFPTSPTNYNIGETFMILVGIAAVIFATFAGVALVIFASNR